MLTTSLVLLLMTADGGVSTFDVRLAGGTPPAGVALDSTLMTLFSSGIFSARLGQRTMANSVPVTLAWDQRPLGIYAPRPLSVYFAAEPTVLIDSAAPVSISASTLPLPAGAAQDSTVAALTKPGDQQHVVIDSVLPNPLPISAASLPLPGGAAQDSTVAGLFTDSQMRADLTGIHPLQPTGWDGGTTTDVSGSVVTLSVAARPLWTNSTAPPLNPLLPRCNPVRRTGCQP